MLAEGGLELIVHIGSGKAGSTSIQASLAASHEGLAEQRIFYMGLLGENLPVKLFSWQRPEAWAELIAQGGDAAGQLLTLFEANLEPLRQKAYEKILWSHEAMLNHPDLLLPLFEHLSQLGMKVKAIVYFRRHDVWARSAYMQWGIKHKTYKGPLKSFAEWIKTRNLKYFPKLEPWLKADYLDLRVRNFDACADVVLDFCSLCGAEGSSLQLRRSNQSPSAVALALWALYNAQSEQEVLPAVLQPSLAQAGILDMEIKDIDFETLFPTDDDMQVIREEMKTDRAKLDALFEASGQSKMDAEPLVFEPMQVSQNQISAALLMLAIKQAERISALENKVTELLRQQA